MTTQHFEEWAAGLASAAPASTSRTICRRAGGLALALETSDGGLHLRSLFDLASRRELIAPGEAPLFTLVLRKPGSKDELALGADEGWRDVDIRLRRTGLTLTWARPADERLAGLAVTATARPDHRRHAWRWTLRVDGPGTGWSVWEVTFPCIAFRKFDPQAVVLVPSGPGELKRGAWDAPMKYREPYGQAWCAMQFMAAYADSDEPTGLYLADHDPYAGAKDLSAESDLERRCVRLAFHRPASGRDQAGNDFELSGEAVWQLLRGDWFDAALIYKDWARQHARWWPNLSVEGRADTPAWMRDLGAWLQAGFEPGTQRGMAPDENVEAIKRFREYIGLPVGLHWYAWHCIPFDNDYPHYFPAKPGLAEAVRELHREGVFSMPYINGRLWDTRDRGVEDFEFSRLALPAATKDEDGRPFVESYGSTEADGSPVRLAVMCPSTPLWQERVRGIVMRLFEEIGTDGVYIDQVAAARPMPCMDSSHGHPAGGGHWWNEGYWQMLDAIRATLPAGRMITTECNAEAFVRWFDGYLTWHWQHDGMVPVFPAVYAGTVQMFGRSYGQVDRLATRMKAAQQFVFGEQIGWFGPNILDDLDNAEFVRRLACLRWAVRRYFNAGEMARPPRLLGSVPAVRADWQWYGECWVATDAVLAGAWRSPAEGSAILQFVNVSDESISAELRFDARDYGLSGRRISVCRMVEPGLPGELQTWPRRARIQVELAPRAAWVWELSSG